MVIHSTAGDGGNRRASVFERLYIGNGAFDIVGKRMRWYVSLGLLVLVCIGAMGLKGFNLGIDFEGGTKLQVPAVGAQGPISEDQVQEAFTEALGHPAETVQLVGTANSQTIQVRTESLNTAQVSEVKETMFQRLQPLGADGEPSPAAVSDSAVSGTWGGEITQQALLALGVFLVLVTVFLAFYFERWMAVAALIALLHDVVVTAGIYALTGFEVTPSTVIGLLTILGFSLYDTVVVFDKVKENTRGLLGLTRRSYPEAANLAVNQTLMRSINTSVIALLPVIGLLVVGAWLLGVGVLRDLALVQLVGMIAGVVSSIFLATPLLVDFKMRDRRYRQQAAKVAQRRERGSAKETGEPSDEQAEEGSERTLAGASSAAGKRAARSDAPQNRRRPAGKSSRPTGKKRR
ncbi:protein translocase subunit SecF [Saccharopolyspora sp. 6V]|nr:MULTISPECIES: protein translocase subunit SecF [unclassified Saccharopolyspora]MCA1189221.1 protein translocase subunit SecF [Saccharopolyspora sp. 6T]MCA1192726.1 protein translocase subunit SecF [Saccharopolyspora sp. 6V]MCA1226019.1 protein translocase subunit SecF [Saccharopolyspora sp. 6M]MCA1279508.1 protein translocase subunit SecF [Saccharopolyspora sp. 7B]